MPERSSTQRTLDLSSHAFLLKTLQQICRLLIFSDSFLRRKIQHRFKFRWLGCSRKSRSLFRYPTRSADQLHENLRAVDVQLTPADLREIESALSKIEVHGGRMNEERMKLVDQTV